MPECVHVEWANQDPPPTRTMFDVCRESGWTDERWADEVKKAIKAHWAIKKPKQDACASISWSTLPEPVETCGYNYANEEAYQEGMLDDFDAAWEDYPPPPE